MRKLTYEKKARVRLIKVGSGYMAEYRLPNHPRVFGVGRSPESAWSSLHSVLHDFHVIRQMAAIKRDMERPDVGLGASDDYHIATSNLPWWKRLFRI